jgi:hypothetical protein
MELKYAVVSSNSNPEYLDFWPYVAKAWQRIGIEPVLLYIDSTDLPHNMAEYGRYYNLRSISEWNIIQQAQSIRFWAAKLLDAPFIISDMDMLPISKEYYQNGVRDASEDQIVSYSSDVIKYRWYKKNPQYPMCYLAGHPQSFIDLLEMNESDHNDFLRRLMGLNIPQGTDQKFFYNQSLKFPERIKHLERGWIQERYAQGRLDKVVWPNIDYNVNEYIDCHLPRPLSSNKEICNILFQKTKIL